MILQGRLATSQDIFIKETLLYGTRAKIIDNAGISMDYTLRTSYRRRQIKKY